jgi:hypothetical protein
MRIPLLSLHCAIRSGFIKRANPTTPKQSKNRYAEASRVTNIRVHIFYNLLMAGKGSYVPYSLSEAGEQFVVYVAAGEDHTYSSQAWRKLSEEYGRCGYRAARLRQNLQPRQ